MTREIHNFAWNQFIALHLNLINSCEWILSSLFSQLLLQIV